MYEYVCIAVKQIKYCTCSSEIVCYGKKKLNKFIQMQAGQEVFHNTQIYI